MAKTAIPKKSETTRQKIVEQAAAIFNQHGYSGTSITAIMEATGLEKGGIYRHFASKEELAMAALEYNLAHTARIIQSETAKVGHAIEKLKVMINTFRDIFALQLYGGGCPMQNTAIEGAASTTTLHALAQQAMTDMLDTIVLGIRRGIERGELSPSIDPQTTATVFMATLEGGLMLSQLYGDFSHLQRIVQYLHQMIDNIGHA